MSRCDEIIVSYEDWLKTSAMTKVPSNWVESSEKVMDFGELVPIYAFRFIWKNRIPTLHLITYGRIAGNNHISISSVNELHNFLISRGI